MKKILVITIGIFYAFYPLNSRALFNDITDQTESKSAIEYLSNSGIINGYPDNTYRPLSRINRAEFLKILIEAKKTDFDELKSQYDQNCFLDIHPGSWYTPYVCYAKNYSIINGYPDGNFLPSSNIKLVEALKIIVNVFQIEKGEEGENWYDPFLNAMADRGYIPDNFYDLSQYVTRGQMAEMTWRVMENLQSLPFVTAMRLKDPDCQLLNENVPNNINMNKVRETWLKWYNDARAEAGKSPYEYNDQLTRTAIAWSEISKERGYMDHKRDGQTAYYDYGIIRDWFADKGLTFANVNGLTFTENIAWGPFKCTSNDCTDSFIESIEYSFDSYMNEKGTANQAHYTSIMNDQFKIIGLGIAIDSNKYYLTVHYATKITSDPLPICK